MYPSEIKIAVAVRSHDTETNEELEILEDEDHIHLFRI